MAAAPFLLLSIRGEDDAAADEYAPEPAFEAAASFLAVATVAVAFPRVGLSSRIFVLIGLGLVARAAVAVPDWPAETLTALGRRRGCRASAARSAAPPLR